ncbi:MAG: hypothetical protein ETSY1_15820 [Candidatus Entotheonella factor]|uniref:Phosphoglycerate mutase n=1 Tax=Entotheonella factor TaxID=1429438 RepID=W4LND1_ENTF1|nr:histidine phosphatase family protein [Candidatus Entotheonella palauensis]ETW99225.1 MAG: hypothetical protein ETSY1_15820 [Candidatus Entotheonella factor]
METFKAQKTTRWWWIRHAPVPQLADRIYGSTDPDADVSDVQRFTLLAQSLPPQAVWVVSSLRRTHQTAKAIEAAGYALPELIVEPGFIEQNFGALHGVLHVEHETARTDPFRDIWPTPPDVTPPGGESFVDVMSRVAAAVERLSEHHRGRDIVCIGHGGSIRAAVAHALGLSPVQALSLSFKNLTLTRLQQLHSVMDGGPSWQVLGFNEGLMPL